MYVTTIEGVGQTPMLYNSFAGTLGKNLLPPAIQEFLKQVRKRPQDYKKLLLTITFHPNPIESNIDVTIGGTTTKFLEHILLQNITAVDLLDELRLIRDDFQKTNKSFKRQIEAALKLRNIMFKTTGRLVRDELLRTRGKLVPHKLKPFLLDALQPGYSEFSFHQHKVGLSFAQKILPPTLVQRIIRSEVSEAHLTNLGKMLRRYAEVLGKRDTAFEQLVEQERKKLLAPKKKKP